MLNPIPSFSRILLLLNFLRQERLSGITQVPRVTWGNRISMPLPALKIDAEELLQHLGWMKRLALSMLGDEALAEDAVSET